MALPQTSDEQFNERYSSVGNVKRNPLDRGGRNTNQNNDTARRTNTRNVRVETARTSNMPGSPSNQKFDSSRKSTDQIFNESYAKQGLQPSYAASNENRAPRYQQPDQLTRNPKVEYSSQPMVAPRVKTQKHRIKLRKKHKKLAPIARVRVTGVNIWLIGWGMFFWISFQVPMALISAGFFGLAGFVDYLFENVSITDDSLSWGEYFLRKAANTVGELLKFITDIVNDLFSINIDILGMPHNLFMMTYLLIFAFGMITLLLVYFTYAVSFLRPLSGSGAGLKKGMLLLCLVGYSIPILNLFPWFLAWTIAVWFYPK